jgi:hypothetical protein
MAVTGHIYDPMSGQVLARVHDDGSVVSAASPGRKIATVRDRDMFDTEGVLIGHLDTGGGLDPDALEALRRLF